MTLPERFRRNPARIDVTDADKVEAMQAQTDPIAPAQCIPRAAIEQNPLFSLVVTPAGGHLGWVSPAAPLQGPWTDGPVVEWLQSMTRTLNKA